MTPPTREVLEARAAGGDEAAQLDLADALDAEGRHADAIDLLSRAARLGSVRAKGRVGMRILIGDRAPSYPAQGAGLLEEAAREGGAEAAALLAVLAGAGAYRRQSWSEALDWLLRAAELGLPTARAQLCVLAADRALAAAARPPSAPAPGLWRRLRESIDVAELIAAPAGETLSADPLIRRFGAFASPHVCAWLVDRARGGLTRATIYHGDARKSRVSETRTNSIRIFGLGETDLVQLLLQSRMAAAASVPFSHMEAISVLHYAPGEQITEHFDFISPDAPNHAEQSALYGERVITFLVYLNDDYAGGETEFPRVGVTHRGVMGEGLYFVNALASGPDLRTVHAGRPPRDGEKWIVSQFIRSRPFVPGAAA